MPDAALAGEPRPPRVALVHDWLTGMRGGEKVLESLCRLYPDAPVYTLVHRTGAVSAAIERHTIRRSFIQRLPFGVGSYRHFLPVFPIAVECFDLDEADLVVSTSHCAAKSVIRRGDAVHVCYCHSPMRYAWDQFDAYFGPDRIGPALNRLARPVLARLARWDRDTAGRVDRYLSNSQYVAGRIRRYYNRTATVVHPPVDTEFFTPDLAAPGTGLLAVSALVPYKRLDVAIAAAALAGEHLTIVGTGPDEARLRRLAGGGVTFAGHLDGPALRQAYRRAAAILLPGEEDFGIAPVEAMACGRPAIALGRGGAAETVHPGETGCLVEEPSASAFAEGIDRARRTAWDSGAIRRHAEQFGVERFESALMSAISEAWRTAASC